MIFMAQAFLTYVATKFYMKVLRLLFLLYLRGLFLF
jgi:hypothetical protein